MKTSRIEVQRLKNARNASTTGTVSIDMDCLIAPRRQADDAEPASELVLSEADARTLLSLLKKQIAAFDARKPKSRF
jgi:hypothetical protein